MKFILVLLIFINCSENSNKPSLAGVWKEKKQTSNYSQGSLETLYQIQESNDQLLIKVIGLPNSVEGNGEIRKCKTCGETENSRALLGAEIGRAKFTNSKFQGKFYDSYSRKWYDLRIKDLGDTIELRYYAYFPIIGKSIFLTKGESTLTEIKNKPPKKYSNDSSLYALLSESKDKDNFLFDIQGKPILEKYKENYLEVRFY
ncbi:MAG: hypothetical protein SFU98_11240 [Leptospiraceae bacterium]|nr:hypothetical protein [Leptospiraceae bacterium]